MVKTRVNSYKGGGNNIKDKSIIYQSKRLLKQLKMLWRQVLWIFLSSPCKILVCVCPLLTLLLLLSSLLNLLGKKLDLEIRMVLTKAFNAILSRCQNQAASHPTLPPTCITVVSPPLLDQAGHEGGVKNQQDSTHHRQHHNEIEWQHRALWETGGTGNEWPALWTTRN